MPWTVSNARGTVFVLAGTQWHVLVTGDVVAPGQALRTLRGGFLQLARLDDSIEFGPDTTATFGADNERFGIKLYAGRLAIALGPESPGPIAVAATALALTATQASLAMVAAESGTEVEVFGGAARVTEARTGTGRTLSGGQTLTASATGVTAGTIYGPTLPAESAPPLSAAAPSAGWPRTARPNFGNFAGNKK